MPQQAWHIRALGAVPLDRRQNWRAVAAGGRGHRPRRDNSKASITHLTAILNPISRELS
jgi:hypothetical protein